MKEIFEKKYIIGGLFDFADMGNETLYIASTTGVYDIAYEKMVYSQEQYDRVMDELADKGLDYIVFPDYMTHLLPKNIGVSKKIDRLKTMCKDIGWSCIV